MMEAVFHGCFTEQLFPDTLAWQNPCLIKLTNNSLHHESYSNKLSGHFFGLPKQKRDCETFAFTNVFKKNNQ